jgi:hypothetical protein
VTPTPFCTPWAEGTLVQRELREGYIYRTDGAFLVRYYLQLHTEAGPAWLQSNSVTVRVETAV